MGGDGLVAGAGAGAGEHVSADNFQPTNVLLGHPAPRCTHERSHDTFRCTAYTAAGVYRRERWQGPLAAALLLLRECAQNLGDVGAHAALSLEAAALDGGGGGLDWGQRAAMATAAVATLVEPPAASAVQQLIQLEDEGRGIEGLDQRGSAGGGGLRFEALAPGSGWLTVLPICAGFVVVPAATSTASASASPGMRFAAALWSNAPIDLPLASAEVQLKDGRGGSYTAPLLPASASTSGLEASALVLPGGAWLRMAAAVPPRCSGQLQASAVVLRFAVGSGGSSLTYHLVQLLPAPASSPQSPASGGAAGLVGWVRGGWESACPPFLSSSG